MDGSWSFWVPFVDSSHWKWYTTTALAFHANIHIFFQCYHICSVCSTGTGLVFTDSSSSQILFFLTLILYIQHPCSSRLSFHQGITPSCAVRFLVCNCYVQVGLLLIFWNSHCCWVCRGVTIKTRGSRCEQWKAKSGDWTHWGRFCYNASPLESFPRTRTWHCKSSSERPLYCHPQRRMLRVLVSLKVLSELFFLMYS